MPTKTPKRVRRRPAPRSVRLIRRARKLHRWIGVVLLVLMVTLSVTGGFVTYKNHLEYLQPASRTGSAGSLDQVLSPARIAEIVLSLSLPGVSDVAAINRIELRPSKRMYKVRLEPRGAWSPPREIQVDAMTGVVMNRGVRGDQLWMDLHSFAVLGEGAKLVTMTMAALGVLWLSLTGALLFWYPAWYKARGRR